MHDFFSHTPLDDDDNDDNDDDSGEVDDNNDRQIQNKTAPAVHLFRISETGNGWTPTAEGFHVAGQKKKTLSAL